MAKKIALFALSAILAASADGKVLVTASRDYVDRKTQVTAVTNDGVEVGFYLGTNTNQVFASTNVVSGIETNAVSREEFRAATNGIYEALADISTDLITDGTNVIDAAGNVFLLTNVTESTWTFSGGNSGTGADYSIQGPLESGGQFFYYLYESDAVLDLSPYYQTPTNTVIFIETQVTATLHVVSSFVTNFVGRIALTNDLSSAITVVPPSTNAASRQAADAKATGIALYTGYTDWEYGGTAYIPTNTYLFVVSPDPGGSEYLEYKVYENGVLFALYDTQIDPDPTDVTFYTESGILTCSRHLVTPTKTSQLTNDGTNGIPFATTNQIPDVIFSPVYAGSPTFTDWNLSDTRYHLVLTPSGWVPYDANDQDWGESKGTIDSLSLSWSAEAGDAINLTATRTREDPIVGYTLGDQTNKVLAATNAIPAKTSQIVNDGTNGVPFATMNDIQIPPSLSNTYDFASNVGLYTAVRDIILALGGGVTNFPSINGGN